MNNFYLITTAIEQSQSVHQMNGQFYVHAATELEAASIALTGQPDRTYILSIEVYLPQIYLHALYLKPDRSTHS